MKYSDNTDYLIASILYLGVHSYWWARSASAMASELGLDEVQLEKVFNAFPGLFRKSKRVSQNNHHYYALQARYAQKKGGDVSDPDEVSYIAPPEDGKIQLLTNFVIRMGEIELDRRRNRIANVLSVGSALISAGSAIFIALHKISASSQP